MYYHISGGLELVASYKQLASLNNFMNKNKFSSRNSVVIEHEKTFYLFKKNIEATEYTGEFLDIYRADNKIEFDTTFPCEKKDLDSHLKKQAEDIISLLTKN